MQKSLYGGKAPIETPGLFTLVPGLTSPQAASATIFKLAVDFRSPWGGRLLKSGNGLACQKGLSFGTSRPTVVLRKTPSGCDDPLISLTNLLVADASVGSARNWPSSSKGSCDGTVCLVQTYEASGRQKRNRFKTDQ